MSPPFKKTVIDRKDLSDVPDDFKLPQGSVKKGAKLFKKHCSQCHSIYPSNRVGRAVNGPTMWNVYERTAGISDCQGQKSLGTSGIVWNDANLMRYMKHPEAFVEQTVGMVFTGITDFQDRVDIVHYLKTLTYGDPHGEKVLQKYKEHVARYG